MRRSPVFMVLLAGFLLLATAGADMAADLASITIRTKDGRALPLKVELAVTPEQSEHGLMNRPSLPADQGMLFDFHQEQNILMWMKNTMIPLDMIFLDGEGRVVGIAERTVPYSTAVIPSPGPVRGVLEVNGGTADRLKIAIGDRVDNPLFGKN